jgi:hypothetical protein
VAVLVDLELTLVELVAVGSLCLVEEVAQMQLSTAVEAVA